MMHDASPRVSHSKLQRRLILFTVQSRPSSPHYIHSLPGLPSAYMTTKSPVLCDPFFNTFFSTGIIEGSDGS